MTDINMTRRTFAALATGGLLVSVFPGCSIEDEISETDRQALLRVARLLYPHTALSDDVYKDVLRPLRERAESNKNLSAALRSGIDELNRIAARNWLTAPEDEQLDTLKQLENGLFFKTVQEEVRSQLYLHPEVWKLIGYEGSSIEFGGYKDRGFGDIDWLPEDS